MPSEYVLKQDGRVLRRPFEITCPEEKEISIDQAMLATVTKGKVSKFPKLLNLPGIGRLSLCILDDKQGWFLSSRLAVLNLLATYKIGEKEVTPTFQADGEYISIPWTVPDEIDLRFGASGHYDGHFYANSLYLYAIDRRTSVAYLLPVPNLHSDGHMCTGVYENYSETALGAFLQAFNYMQGSRWNDHIIKGEPGRLKCAPKLFRFESTKDGYKTLAPDGKWQNLCQTVATDVLNYFCL